MHSIIHKLCTSVHPICLGPDAEIKFQSCTSTWIWYSFMWNNGALTLKKWNNGRNPPSPKIIPYVPQLIFHNNKCVP